MSVLKLPLLVDQYKVGELVLCINFCASIIVLENTLISVWKICDYGNFNHRYNVSFIHFHALLGVGNFTKVFRMCTVHL
jgi:hypothetical protein